LIVDGKVIVELQSVEKSISGQESAGYLVVTNPGNNSGRENHSKHWYNQA